MIDYRDSLKGYHERMGRIALFNVFNQANNKKKTDQNNQPIDYGGLLLLTLLFFFECMLSRNKASGIKDLAAYLKAATAIHYDLSDEDYQDLARQMIEILRPTGGRRNQTDFMNFETGKRDQVSFVYLKVSGWDKETNQQFYQLDENGLELVFASKEYFNEFQISISQLILRKQLEKGEFVSASRQIDEMRISVHGIRDKMATIKHEVQSNIISEDVYDRYKTLVEDINRRLQREHEEFEELAVFVKETKKHYEQDISHGIKERKAYRAIIHVSNDLLDVHHLHSKLLDESIVLKTKALEAARESMYYVGLASFNFKHEITGKVLGEPMPFMESRKMAKPFLGMAKTSVWSPLALFARQRILRREQDRSMDMFLAFMESKDQALLDQRKRLYKIVFSNVAQAIEKKGKVKLSQLVGEMPPTLQKMKEVYELMILMHQLSPLDVDLVRDSKDHIFSDALSLIGKKGQQLVVEEVGKEIVVIADQSISEMTMELVEAGRSQV